jgi:hypothetical protein
MTTDEQENFARRSGAGDQPKTRGYCFRTILCIFIDGDPNDQEE